jgi:hypothetical protein
MNKLKIFISSRVNSSFKGLDTNYTLTELRKYLREELEKETFLGENIFQIVINEESFHGDLSKDAFDNCMNTMRSCNIIIILYNGEAGWGISNSANGICHEEFLVAMNEFSGMTYAMSLSDLFTLPVQGPEKKRNDAFAADMGRSFRHIESLTAKTTEELKDIILTQIKGYLLDAISKSFETRKQIVAGSTEFGETLDWSKLNYSERRSVMHIHLKSNFDLLPGLEKVIKAFHTVPDNMSVADARNMIGRPFIKEHDLIKRRNEVHGVIHLIAVYGNATEVQVKSLVGYPDLTVIKGTFGYYLWEKNTQIQILFLTKCINSQTIKTRLTQLINWFNGSAELPKIVNRAKARYLILDAINRAQETEGLK